MTMATVPPITFRLRARPTSRCWFVVHVADSLTAMRRTMRKSAGWAHPNQLAAVDSVRITDPRLRGLIGIVYFAKSHLGSGLVAHELTHAAFRYAEHVRVQVRHWEWRDKPATLGGDKTTTVPAEEFLCSVVEHLNREFWLKAYRAGLARPGD